MIVIVDYGLGNLGSIANMLKKIGASAVISGEAETIKQAEKLILPGVGSFDVGMANINRSNLREILKEKVIDQKTPVLGICLGLQLLTRGSEEGKLSGLGWIEAETVAFKFDPQSTGLKIPHMGWNSVKSVRSDSLFSNLDKSRFYFVHSYHVQCEHNSDILATTGHGYDFTCAIRHENIWGTQFHPEKSHRFGKQLLKNFAEMN